MFSVKGVTITVTCAPTLTLTIQQTDTADCNSSIADLKKLSMTNYPKIPAHCTFLFDV